MGQVLVIVCLLYSLYFINHSVISHRFDLSGAIEHSLLVKLIRRNIFCFHFQSNLLLFNYNTYIMYFYPTQTRRQSLRLVIPNYSCPLVSSELASWQIKPATAISTTMNLTLIKKENNHSKQLAPWNPQQKT